MLGKPSFESLSRWLFEWVWRTIELLALWYDELSHADVQRQRLRRIGRWALINATFFLGVAMLAMAIRWFSIGTASCLVSTTYSILAWACERLSAIDDSS